MKTEGWPQPDHVDEEENGIPGPHRPTSFNITVPSRPHCGDPGHSLPALPGLGGALYMDNCFIVLGSWWVFVVSPERSKKEWVLWAEPCHQLRDD